MPTCQAKQCVAGRHSTRKRIARSYHLVANLKQKVAKMNRLRPALRERFLREQRQHARVLEQSRRADRGGAADGSDLEAGEEAADREIAEVLSDIGGVVIRDSI